MCVRFRRTDLGELDDCAARRVVVVALDVESEEERSERDPPHDRNVRFCDEMNCSSVLNLLAEATARVIKNIIIHKD